MGLAEFIQSIGAIQTKITDFIDKDEVLEIDLNKEKFVRKKVCEYLGLETHKKTICINSKGRIALAKSRCPMCGSLNVWCNGWKDRTITSVSDLTITLTVQKYRCIDCGKPFTTPLDDIVNAYARYSKELQSLGIMLHVGCNVSGEEASEIIKFALGADISYKTIERWGKSAGERAGLANADFIEEDIYYHDEQKVRIDGVEKWRYTLLDLNGNIIGEKICEDLAQEHIKDFFIEKLGKMKRVYAIVTDRDKKYCHAIKELERFRAMELNLPLDECRIKHQFCIFHLFQDIVRKLKEVAGFKPWARKRLPDNLNNLKNSLIAVFYHATEAGARKAFEQIYAKRHEFKKKKIINLIEGINRNWTHYTEYYRDRRIPKTTNVIERYFRNTLGREQKCTSKRADNLTARLIGRGVMKKLGHAKMLMLIGYFGSVFTTLGFLAGIMS